MTNKKLTIRHNLDQLTAEELRQYLADVSEYIGLDPDLHGLDTIWMNNETGVGKSLVVYARRGTAEILRNLYNVEVESLTYAQVNGSIVFTATGRNSINGAHGRQEIAIGSKYIHGLAGKILDDAIMTASTRALRRLTMQFTTLGILDESEVVANIGDVPNPAGSAQLADAIPPAFLPPPTVIGNNQPGNLVAPKEEEKAAVQPPVLKEWPSTEYPVKEVDIKTGLNTAPTELKPAESTTSKSTETDIKPTEKPAKKRTRKSKNTVNLGDVEPEVVQDSVPTQADSAAPTQVDSAVSVQADLVKQFVEGTPIGSGIYTPATGEVTHVKIASQVPAPEPQTPTSSSVVSTSAGCTAVAPVAGMPTPEQMTEYRKRISVVTREIPPSQDLGATQKMRAFITKLTGAAPQDMTVKQWEETLGFIDGFLERNQGNVQNLVKYIHDYLGIK